MLSCSSFKCGRGQVLVYTFEVSIICVLNQQKRDIFASAVMSEHKIGSFDELCSECFCWAIIFDEKLHNHFGSDSIATHSREWNFLPDIFF